MSGDCRTNLVILSFKRLSLPLLRMRNPNEPYGCETYQKFEQESFKIDSLDVASLFL